MVDYDFTNINKSICSHIESAEYCVPSLRDFSLLIYVVYIVNHGLCFCPFLLAIVDLIIPLVSSNFSYINCLTCKLFYLIILTFLSHSVLSVGVCGSLLFYLYLPSSVSLLCTAICIYIFFGSPSLTIDVLSPFII